jgi:hypothetical protein
MSDLHAIADRVQIEAPRGEATDAAMMRDYDRVQTTHPGTIQLNGDTASGRAYISGLIPADLPATGIAASPDRFSRAVMEEVT